MSYMTDMEIDLHNKFKERGPIPLIDDWIPEPEDLIFRHSKDVIILPISQMFNIQDRNIQNIDYFMVSHKRSYNNDKVRAHTTHYLNYFIKYFDLDNELISIYMHMKYLIDVETDVYDFNCFMSDVQNYLLSPSILYKVDIMNNYNYVLDLEKKKNNKQKEKLQYTNKHGKVLMKISFLQNVILPLACQFAYNNKEDKVNEFMLKVYDVLINLFSSDVDIYNKIYETASYIVNKSNNKDVDLWGMQSIRGINPSSHIQSCMVNLLLNVLPKSIYSENCVAFLDDSIHRSTKYQITGSSYEYVFVPLSSSDRDEDCNSTFDRFEANLLKSDESIYIHTKVNCEVTIKTIERLFGPFEDEEIEFYLKRIDTINAFQKELVFNLFYKYFGDTTSIKSINKIDYIKLLISAKRMLERSGMCVMPYIISSKISRRVNRKTPNLKMTERIVESDIYQNILARYKNEKIEKIILAMIASILSSKFEIIDYNNKDIDGLELDVIPETIIEEILLMITLISG